MIYEIFICDFSSLMSTEIKRSIINTSIFRFNFVDLNIIPIYCTLDELSKELVVVISDLDKNKNTVTSCFNSFLIPVCPLCYVRTYKENWRVIL